MNDKKLTLESIYDAWKKQIKFSAFFIMVTVISVNYIDHDEFYSLWGKIIIVIGILELVAAYYFHKSYKKLELLASTELQDNKKLEKLLIKLLRNMFLSDIPFYIGVAHYLATNTLLVFLVSIPITLILHYRLMPTNKTVVL